MSSAEVCTQVHIALTTSRDIINVFPEMKQERGNAAWKGTTTDAHGVKAARA